MRGNVWGTHKLNKYLQPVDLKDMASLNNKKHNDAVIKNIIETNKKIKERKDREMEQMQQEILKDSLNSLDVRPAVNRQQGDNRVSDIAKFHRGRI